MQSQSDIIDSQAENARVNSGLNRPAPFHPNSTVSRTFTDLSNWYTNQQRRIYIYIVPVNCPSALRSILYPSSAVSCITGNYISQTLLPSCFQLNLVNESQEDWRAGGREKPGYFTPLNLCFLWHLCQQRYSSTSLCCNSPRWALPSWFKLPLDGLSSLSSLNNLFLVSSRTLR